MTEENSLGVTSPSSEPSQSFNGSSSQPTSETPSQASQQEKLIPQSKVNEIVSRNKQEAYERAKREFAASSQQAEQQPSQQTRSMGGMQQQSPEDIQRLIQESVQKKMSEIQTQAQEEASRKQNLEIANQFLSKLHDVPDVGAILEDLALNSNYAGIIPWLNSVENTKEILQEFHQHPEKYANFLNLANTTPRMAYRRLQEMSAQFKQNKEALSQKRPNEPLSQLTPSPTGTDNGEMTVADMRRKPQFKV